MVIQELIRVIQASIGNMKRYPKLRHEIESVMCNFIRETEQNCKDHVRMLINCELAYINVGNEEVNNNKKTRYLDLCKLW